MELSDLERRALLGDQQAQEECSKQEILLPCPFCGSRKIILSNWGMWRCWCSECLGKGDDELRRHDAVRDWNRRPAPPIGHCRECKYWTPRELDGGKTGMCVRYTPNGYEFSQRTAAGFYCGDFKSKEDANG